MKDKSNKEKIEIKAILLGNSGVGKTNLIKNYKYVVISAKSKAINTSIGLKFEDCYSSTTIGSFVKKLIQIKDKKYSLNLWDTAGQETYKSLTKIFLRKSEIIVFVFVYDITNLKSFKDLEFWIHMCKEMIDNKYVCSIVGNKLDLFTNEEVNENEARKYAESKKMKFKLVSAKDNPKNFNNFLVELLYEHDKLDQNLESENIELTKNIEIVKKDKCKC